LTVTLVATPAASVAGGQALTPDATTGTYPPVRGILRGKRLVATFTTEPMAQPAEPNDTRGRVPADKSELCDQCEVTGANRPCEGNSTPRQSR
jgi:hypothetical protein